MFKEQMNKFKSLILPKTNKEIQKEDKSNKRKIENLVVFLIILIVTMISINAILNKGEVDTKEEEESSYKVLADAKKKENTNTEDELERKLEAILGTMGGVGKVNVLITYTQSSELIPMYNENNTVSHTSETDSNGGTRVVEEQGINKEVIFTEENGSNIPATQKIVNPKIEGVIVTAEGANDANIKANIVAAVEAVTGAQAHKVQVFSMN